MKIIETHNSRKFTGENSATTIVNDNIVLNIRFVDNEPFWGYAYDVNSLDETSTRSFLNRYKEEIYTFYKDNDLLDFSEIDFENLLTGFIM